MSVWLKFYFIILVKILIFSQTCICLINEESIFCCSDLYCMLFIWG